MSAITRIAFVVRMPSGNYLRSPRTEADFWDAKLYRSYAAARNSLNASLRYRPKVKAKDCTIMAVVVALADPNGCLAKDELDDCDPQDKAHVEGEGA